MAPDILFDLLLQDESAEPDGDRVLLLDVFLADSAGRTRDGLCFGRETGMRRRLVIVYTIGHSNVDVEEIIRLLREYGREMVLDVRSSPYSRFSPQFNRETLAESLWKAGIEYIYAGDRLGGRPRYADASCYEGGKLSRTELEKRRWYQEAIDRLVEVATGQTAIVCAEENPKHCHRQLLIAQTLLDRGIEVQPIRGDGTLEEAEREPEQLSLSLEE